MDNLCSFLPTCVNYGRKFFFITLGPGNVEAGVEDGVEAGLGSGLENLLFFLGGDWIRTLYLEVKVQRG